MESGLNFIDFLKYGAIGIALALAILSYRLLSKEQEKETVRKEMLTSIKTFFMLSILLSVFFGVTEIVTLSISSEPKKDNKGIDKIWNKHFADFDEKTNKEKIRRINEYVHLGFKSLDSSDCSELAQENLDLREELQQQAKGFYSVVAELDNLIYQYENRFINLGHQPEDKIEVFDLLPVLLVSLEVVHASEELTTEEIVAVWCDLKKKWNIPDKHRKNIYPGDIRRLLSEYHDLMDDRV